MDVFQLKMKYSKIFFHLLMVILMIKANAEEVICQEQELNNVQILMGHPGITPPYTSGHVLVFKCTDVNMKLYGHRAIECQSDGNWENPYPQCQVIKTDCEPPPNMNHKNADTLHLLDQRKTEYKSGEKVEYTCLATYTMEGDPHMTCAQGKWEGHFTCIEPCYASQPEMDKRNIQLRKSEFERMYVPHLDHLTFVCKSGKYRKRNSVHFRQQCQYGKMTLPECE
ncbi:complement factor H-related protein 2-like [Misgurnus anguillicaudatus]|uniref:complement factor H-related protein 2-like n=1 Tax=Misgurnus anguillicaudatus TaxID=75329 RepID=UPI003CCFCA16